jgi:hypothetical protein
VDRGPWAWTLGARAQFLDYGARLLWEHFPLNVQLELEEGLTEPDFQTPEIPFTNWRKALRPLGS